MMKMTSPTLIARAVTLALFASVAAVASANSLTIGITNGYYANNGTGGGEFTVTSNDAQLLNIRNNYNAKAIVNGGFETFCLEINEEFYSGNSYTYALSDAAKSGGAGGAVNGKDPVSVGSAWLYSQFAAGTLAGYNYTSGLGRQASAGLLQNAIWWLEDEIKLADPYSNTFLSAALNHFGGINSAKSDNQGAYAVGVINLGVNSGNQDQIVLLPVPDGGATIALFGAALLALAAVRRRQSQ